MLMRIAAVLALVVVMACSGSARGGAATQPAGVAATRPAGAGGFGGAATRPAAIYIDPATGFSIVPPKFSEGPQRMVVFYAPAQNGVAATCQIHVDTLRTTRREWLNVTLRQAARADAKMNSTKELTVGGYDAVLLDYESTANVRRWRYLQMAVITEDAVYIVTCTSPVDAFEQHREAFQRCLDSFRPPVKQ